MYSIYPPWPSTSHCEMNRQIPVLFSKVTRTGPRVRLCYPLEHIVVHLRHFTVILEFVLLYNFINYL